LAFRFKKATTALESRILWALFGDASGCGEVARATVAATRKRLMTGISARETATPR